MSFPLEAVRRATPGVEHVTHLNNAGSSLPSRGVLDCVIGHLQREAEIGGYEAADEADSRVEATYDAIAALLGARRDQVAVIENATRAWDMAVYGYPFRAGDRVLVGRAEYASNAIALLQLQRRHGTELVVVDDDEHGQISLGALEAELARGAAMVSLTHIPTNGGLVNPAAAVGELCRRYDTFFVLDACQSVGQLPLDVGAIGCDVLSATGRKFLRAPRGTGLLVLSDRALGLLEPPMLDLHAATWDPDGSYTVRSDARRFENWETNYAAKLGLGAAVEEALALGLDAIWARVEALGAELRAGLSALPGITAADKGSVLCGIVSFAVAGVEADAVQAELRRHAINTSVTTVGSTRFDLAQRGIDSLVRASVHYYNSAEELDRLIAAVATMARR